MNGIDISSYQTGINLQKISGDFVIIKATEGINYVNPACNDQYSSAKKANKKVGFYHFATSGTDAKTQANYFVNNVENYLIDDHCLAALDWESDAITMGPKWAKEFLDAVANRIKATPLIYMSKSVTQQYDWSLVAEKYALWGAQYATSTLQYDYLENPWSDNKPWGSWKTPTIFQYTSNGRLENWPESLDLNKAYFERNTWDKFTNLERKSNK